MHYVKGIGVNFSGGQFIYFMPLKILKTFFLKVNKKLKMRNRVYGRYMTSVIELHIKKDSTTKKWCQKTTKPL